MRITTARSKRLTTALKISVLDYSLLWSKKDESSHKPINFTVMCLLSNQLIMMQETIWKFSLLTRQWISPTFMNIILLPMNFNINKNVVLVNKKCNSSLSLSWLNNIYIAGIAKVNDNEFNHIHDKRKRLWSKL